MNKLHVKAKHKIDVIKLLKAVCLQNSSINFLRVVDKRFDVITGRRGYHPYEKHLLAILKECLVSHRWLDALHVLPLVVRMHKNNGHILFKSVFQVLTNLALEETDTLEQFLRLMSNVYEVFLPEVALETLNYFLSISRLPEAVNICTNLLATYKKKRKKPSSVQRDRTEALLKVYQGMIEHHRWSALQQQMEEDNPEQRCSETMKAHADKAMFTFEQILQHPGEFDVFINKHVQLKDFYSNQTGATEALRIYAEKNPGHWTAQQLLYDRLKVFHPGDIQERYNVLQSIMSIHKGDGRVLDIIELTTDYEQAVTCLFLLMDYQQWFQDSYAWSIMCHALFKFFNSSRAQFQTKVSQMWVERRSTWLRTALKFPQPVPPQLPLDILYKAIFLILVEEHLEGNAFMQELWKHKVKEEWVTKLAQTIMLRHGEEGNNSDSNLGGDDGQQTEMLLDKPIPTNEAHFWDKEVWQDEEYLNVGLANQTEDCGNASVGETNPSQDGIVVEKLIQPQGEKTGGEETNKLEKEQTNKLEKHKKKKKKHKIKDSNKHKKKKKKGKDKSKKKVKDKTKKNYKNKKKSNLKESVENDKTREKLNDKTKEKKKNKDKIKKNSKGKSKSKKKDIGGKMKQTTSSSGGHIEQPVGGSNLTAMTSSQTPPSSSDEFQTGVTTVTYLDVTPKRKKTKTGKTKAKEKERETIVPKTWGVPEAAVDQFDSGIPSSHSLDTSFRSFSQGVKRVLPQEISNDSSSNAKRRKTDNNQSKNNEIQDPPRTKEVTGNKNTDHVELIKEAGKTSVERAKKNEKHQKEKDRLSFGLHQNYPEVEGPSLGLGNLGKANEGGIRPVKHKKGNKETENAEATTVMASSKEKGNIDVIISSINLGSNEIQTDKQAKKIKHKSEKNKDKKKEKNKEGKKNKKLKKNKGKKNNEKGKERKKVKKHKNKEGKKKKKKEMKRKKETDDLSLAVKHVSDVALQGEISTSQPRAISAVTSSPTDACTNSAVTSSPTDARIHSLVTSSPTDARTHSAVTSSPTDARTQSASVTDDSKTKKRKLSREPAANVGESDNQGKQDINKTVENTEQYEYWEGEEGMYGDDWYEEEEGYYGADGDWLEGEQAASDETKTKESEKPSKRKDKKSKRQLNEQTDRDTARDNISELDLSNSKVKKSKTKKDKNPDVDTTKSENVPEKSALQGVAVPHEETEVRDEDKKRKKKKKNKREVDDDTTKNVDIRAGPRCEDMGVKTEATSSGKSSTKYVEDNKFDFSTSAVDYSEIDLFEGNDLDSSDLAVNITTTANWETSGDSNSRETSSRKKTKKKKRHREEHLSSHHQVLPNADHSVKKDLNPGVVVTRDAVSESAVHSQKKINYDVHFMSQECGRKVRFKKDSMLLVPETEEFYHSDDDSTPGLSAIVAPWSGAEHNGAGVKVYQNGIHKEMDIRDSQTDSIPCTGVFVNGENHETEHFNEDDVSSLTTKRAKTKLNSKELQIKLHKLKIVRLDENIKPSENKQTHLSPKHKANNQSNNFLINNNNNPNSDDFQPGRNDIYRDVTPPRCDSSVPGTPVSNKARLDYLRHSGVTAPSSRRGIRHRTALFHQPKMYLELDDSLSDDGSDFIPNTQLQ